MELPSNSGKNVVNTTGKSQQVPQLSLKKFFYDEIINSDFEESVDQICELNSLPNSSRKQHPLSARGHITDSPISINKRFSEDDRSMQDSQQKAVALSTLSCPVMQHTDSFGSTTTSNCESSSVSTMSGIEASRNSTPMTVTATLSGAIPGVGSASCNTSTPKSAAGRKRRLMGTTAAAGGIIGSHHDANDSADETEWGTVVLVPDGNTQDSHGFSLLPSIRSPHGSLQKQQQHPFSADSTRSMPQPLLQRVLATPVDSVGGGTGAGAEEARSSRSDPFSPPEASADPQSLFRQQRTQPVGRPVLPNIERTVKPRQLRDHLSASPASSPTAAAASAAAFSPIAGASPTAAAAASAAALARRKSAPVISFSHPAAAGGARAGTGAGAFFPLGKGAIAGNATSLQRARTVTSISPVPLSSAPGPFLRFPGSLSCRSADAAPPPIRSIGLGRDIGLSASPLSLQTCAPASASASGSAVGSLSSQQAAGGMDAGRRGNNGLGMLSAASKRLQVNVQACAVAQEDLDVLAPSSPTHHSPSAMLQNRYKQHDFPAAAVVVVNAAPPVPSAQANQQQQSQQVLGYTASAPSTPRVWYSRPLYPPPPQLSQLQQLQQVHAAGVSASASTSGLDGNTRRRFSAPAATDAAAVAAAMSAGCKEAALRRLNLRGGRTSRNRAHPRCSEALLCMQLNQWPPLSLEDRQLQASRQHSPSALLHAKQKQQEQQQLLGSEQRRPTALLTQQLSATLEGDNEDLTAEATGYASNSEDEAED